MASSFMQRMRRRPRDVFAIANRVRLRSPTARGFPVSVGDRRLYHPQRMLRPAFASPRAAARIVDRRPVRFPTMLAFAVPQRVAVCVRRHMRREVLLALGRGGAGHKRPRRNVWSSVKC